VTAGVSKGAWVLTPAAFDRLLNRLDASPERAGEKYEELRRRLAWFFEMKGSFQPAEDADETLNRVARRIDEGQAVDNLIAYAHGVARMVLLETLRRQARERAGEAAFVLRGAPGGEDADRWTCLDTCMNALPPADRELILAYYGEEQGGRVRARKGLADRLGIPSPLLRVRTFRIRERLEGCVHRCLGRSGSAARATPAANARGAPMAGSKTRMERHADDE